MLEGGAICIVVGRVAVDEAIQEEGVEWEAPVGRRGVILVVPPFTWNRSVSGLWPDEGAQRVPTHPNTAQDRLRSYSRSD